ncbi:hypothetical protein ACIHFE_09400 [Streptomyces sp. NPDC052396]|uniref:hypothetical protein n=1 Tax=Streptomyces sp. NPDC052396 TaxID=3365689 RepID=UPI0037D35B03
MASSITYRCGAWLMDTERGKVGQLMDEDKRDGVVYLRPPGGGREWTVEPSSVRLATDQDFKDANLVRRRRISWVGGRIVDEVLPRAAT